MIYENCYITACLLLTVAVDILLSFFVDKYCTGKSIPMQVLIIVTTVY